MPQNERFPRWARLRRSREFLNVQRGGRKKICPDFVVFTKISESKESRLGVTVSLKVSRSAVVRNLVKRRIREFFRKNRQKLRTSLDIVVIARENAALIGYSEISVQLSRALAI